MLLIDTVLKKIVRAGLIGSMVEADDALRRFFLGLKGANHERRPRSGSAIGRRRPSIQANCTSSMEGGQVEGEQAAGTASDPPPWIGLKQKTARTGRRLGRA